MLKNTGILFHSVSNSDCKAPGGTRPSRCDGRLPHSTQKYSPLYQIIGLLKETFSVIMPICTSNSVTIRSETSSFFPWLRALSLPTPSKLEYAFGSYRLDWRQEGDAVVIERQLHINLARVAPQDYEAFRAFVAAVQDADEGLLVFQTKEAR